jgi:hypothetical protein
VLRLAGLFWRLRRATAIEAGLFEIQAEHVSDLRRERHVDPVPRQIVCPTLRQSSLQPDYEAPVSFATGEPEMALPADPRVADPANPSVDLAPLEVDRQLERVQAAVVTAQQAASSASRSASSAETTLPVLGICGYPRRRLRPKASRGQNLRS